MRNLLIIGGLSLTFAGGLSQTTSAALIGKASTDFSGKYEATALPESASPAWTYGGSLPISTYNSVGSGILTLDTLSPTGMQLSNWKVSGTDWNASGTAGYTVEMKLKIDSVGAPSSDVNSGFWLSAEDGAHHVTLRIFDNEIIDRWNSTNATLNTADNTDNFHIFRLAVLPGGTQFNLWRDGQLIVSDRAMATSSANQLFFGDPTGSANSPDMKIQVDYIRWDTTGAYAPVPEPTSGVLLGIALVGFLAKRRRK